MKYVDVTNSSIVTNATVNEGEPIKLTCGNSNDTSEWTRDDALVVQTDRVKVEGPDLVIANASISDAGTYKCIRTTPKERKTYIVNLWVNGK